MKMKLSNKILIIGLGVMVLFLIGIMISARLILDTYIGPEHLQQLQEMSQLQRVLPEAGFLNFS